MNLIGMFAKKFSDKTSINHKLEKINEEDNLNIENFDDKLRKISSNHQSSSPTHSILDRSDYFIGDSKKVLSLDRKTSILSSDKYPSTKKLYKPNKSRKDSIYMKNNKKLISGLLKSHVINSIDLSKSNVISNIEDYTGDELIDVKFKKKFFLMV